MAGLDPATQGHCPDAEKQAHHKATEVTKQLRVLGSVVMKRVTVAAATLGGRVKPGHDGIF
jgi:hypothetical protein